MKMCVSVASLLMRCSQLFDLHLISICIAYAGDGDSRPIQVLIAFWKRSWRTRRKKRSDQMVPPKETTDLLNICCSVCSFLVHVVVGKFL